MRVYSYPISVTEITYEASTKISKKEREGGVIQLHITIPLYTEVIKEIPKDLWKFPEVKVKVIGTGKTIRLTNVLKASIQQNPYFTIPVPVAKKYSLDKEKEKVKVTLKF